MSNKELTDYQQACSDEIIRRVISGKRRLSLFMPTGTGKTDVVLHVIDKIGVPGQKILLVFDTKILAEAFQADDSGSSKAKVEAIDVEDLIERQLKADVLFLMELRPYSRMLLSKYLGKKNEALVVSFASTPPTKKTETKRTDYFLTDPQTGKQILLEVEEYRKGTDYAERAIRYAALLAFKPLVIETEDVLDPRDIATADEDEKEAVSRIIVEEKNRAETCISDLSIIQQNEVLKEALETLSWKVEIYERMLTCCGISITKLEEAFTEIEAERKSMKAELNSENETVKEQAIASFENKVSAMVSRIVKDEFPNTAKEDCVEVLRELLSEAVWDNKLSEEAKTCLVSARSLFDAMNGSNKRDSIDYSGVCLLITKAVDYEIARRLYTKYIQYLERRYPIGRNIERWPHALLNQERTGILEETYFTLGTAAYVVGINENGTIKNSYAYRLFMEYARDELYDRSMSNTELETKVKNLVECVEKIRTDYRNPSAHREGINYITAKECMDYTIETYKKLKEILECMTE